MGRGRHGRRKEGVGGHSPPLDFHTHSLEDLFFFLRSHQNPDKTVAFSPSVLEFTKLEMRNI